MAGGGEGLWPPLLSDLFALGACSPVTGSSAGARGGGRSSWAGVFHRAASGSGVGVLGRVVSIHRLDGQCCLAGWGVELLWWRGGFRDECVPTICCAHPRA